MRAPMINSTKQSIAPQRGKLDCFVASLLAMTTLRGTTPVISIFSLCFILVVARLDRTTQYAARLRELQASLEYWIIRFRG